jgi:hypothetical protein
MILVSKHSAIWKVVLIKTMLPTFTGSFIIFGFTKAMVANMNNKSAVKKTN